MFKLLLLITFLNFESYSWMGSPTETIGECWQNLNATYWHYLENPEPPIRFDIRRGAEAQTALS